MNNPPILGPPCPTCQSRTTVRVAERPDVVTFFCPDCQSVWEGTPRHLPVAAGEAAMPRSIDTSPNATHCPRCTSVQVERLPSSVVKGSIYMTCTRCGHLWKVVARDG
jgi:transposase-like protein